MWGSLGWTRITGRLGCRLLDCRGWGRIAAAADRPALDVVLPCKKNRKEEGPARVSPVAAPMPKSVSF